jgi:DNA-binding MarR family transcriptional regulator
MDQKKAKKFHELNEEISLLLSEIESINSSELKLGKVETLFLQFLFEVDKPVNMKTITNHLKVSQSRITHLTDSLIEKGFVDRYASKEDRRVNFAYLTDKGKDVVSKKANGNTKFYAAQLEKYDSKKVDQLLESLNDWKKILIDFVNEMNK